MAQLQPIKVRTLIQALLEVGCESIRQTGSHGIYRTPKTGRSFSIVVNHLNREVSLVVLSNVRRVLKAEGIDIFDTLAKKLREAEKAPALPEPPKSEVKPRGPYNYRTPEEKVALLQRALELRAKGTINADHVVAREAGPGFSYTSLQKWRRTLEQAGYRLTLEKPLPPEAVALLDGKQQIRDAAARRGKAITEASAVEHPVSKPNGDVSLDAKRAILAELEQSKNDLTVLARLARDHADLTVATLARWRDEVEEADLLGKGTVEERLLRLEATVARLVRSLGGL